MIDKDVPITVLMVTYNDKKYIEEAIVSVLQQTMTDFEFLIIDDASTDGTSQILAKYAKKDSRIRLVRSETNLGLTKQLNIGLRLAKGKYIARMDGDDISHPERLEHQYVYMLNHPNCYFLATEGVLIGETGKKIKDIQIDFKGLSQKEYILNYGSPFIHSSMFFSKKSVLEIGGYNENYHTRQDLELWLRIIYSGMEIHVLRKPLISLRYHSQSLSHKSTENLYVNVIIKVLYRAKDLGIVNIEIDKIENMVKRNPAINNYIQRVLARKKLKAMVSFFVSGELIKGIGSFFRLVPSLHSALSRPVPLIPIIDDLLKNTQIFDDNRKDNDTNFKNKN